MRGSTVNAASCFRKSRRKRGAPNTRTHFEARCQRLPHDPWWQNRAVAVPDYQMMMLPALQAASDGQEHPIRDLIEDVANLIGISAADRAELLPSGRTPVYVNRIHWAVTYLAKAALLVRPKRGIVLITPEGKRVIGTKPTKIDSQFLEQYQGFRDFQARSKAAAGGHQIDVASAESEPPEETLTRAWAVLQRTVADGILERLRSCSPKRFEEIVVELLVKMGYGGSYADAAAVIGQPGDGGVDGVIKEDRLGLDAIYIQAKRWQSSVQRQDVQAFVGSLEGKRARKGVMITTSSFTDKAQQFASMIEKKVVLIDGSRLADLMVEFHVGVAANPQEYRVDHIDDDYFILGYPSTAES